MMFFNAIHDMVCVIIIVYVLHSFSKDTMQDNLLTSQCFSKTNAKL
jgi:hypothetical protein